MSLLARRWFASSLTSSRASIFRRFSSISETDNLRAILEQNANFQKAISTHVEEEEEAVDTKKLQERHSLVAQVMGLEGLDPKEAANKREEEVVAKLRHGVRPHPAKSRFRSFDEEDERERREKVEKELKRKDKRVEASISTVNAFQTLVVSDQNQLPKRYWDEDEKHINERTGKRKNKGKKTEKEEESDHEPISHEEMHVILKGIQSGELKFTDELQSISSQAPHSVQSISVTPEAAFISFLEDTTQTKVPRGSQTRLSASPMRSFDPTRKPIQSSPQSIQSSPQPIQPSPPQPIQTAPPQPIQPSPPPRPIQITPPPPRPIHVPPPPPSPSQVTPQSQASPKPTQASQVQSQVQNEQSTNTSAKPSQPSQSNSHRKDGSTSKSRKSKRTK